MSSRYATNDSPSIGLSWSLLVTYSLVVCALHFGGLEYELYTRFPWWDLLTHSLSGVGVAAWLSLVRLVPIDPNQVLTLTLAVLAIGAGFEVYEYVFKSFYTEWTLTYYAVDTAVDLAVDAGGAAAFAWWCHRRRESRSLPTE